MNPPKSRIEYHPPKSILAGCGCLSVSALLIVAGTIKVCEWVWGWIE